MKTPASTATLLPTGGVGHFPPTRWTLVLRARGASPESQVALSALCETFYAPVLAFLRREGRSEDATRELTQEFFSRLLANPHLGGVEPGRGRFRSYLLGGVKHFLGEERQRAAAAKWGGGQAPLSLDAAPGTDTTSELQVADPAASVPDTWFDRQGATTLVDRAVAALGAEAEAEGRHPLPQGKLPETLDAAFQNTVLYELIHLSILIPLLPMMAVPLQHEAWIAGGCVVAVNIVINVYPIMVQRYNRVRLLRLISAELRQRWSLPPPTGETVTHS